MKDTLEHLVASPVDQLMLQAAVADDGDGAEVSDSIGDDKEPQDLLEGMLLSFWG